MELAFHHIIFCLGFFYSLAYLKIFFFKFSEKSSYLAAKQLKKKKKVGQKCNKKKIHISL